MEEYKYIDIEGYLGETKLNIEETKYAFFTPQDWVMLWIEKYGDVSGDHYKAWLLDQLARILKGTKIIVKVAKWKNGHTEERFNLDDPPQKYWDWVKEMKAGEDGPETYDYDFGIAP